MAGERGVDRCETLQMTDFVLRVAAIETEDAREQRIAAHADERLQCAE